MHTYENLPPPKNRDRVKQPVNTTVLWSQTVMVDLSRTVKTSRNETKQRGKTEVKKLGSCNQTLGDKTQFWIHIHDTAPGVTITLRTKELPFLYHHFDLTRLSVCACVWGGAGVAGLETASLFWTHKNLKLVSSKIKTTRTFQCATHIWGLLFGDCMFVLCRCVLSGVMTSPDLTTLN